MKTRTIVMTVYAIKAQQVDISNFGEPAGSRYMNGSIRISARGGGEEHTWLMRDGERHYWPGDTVTVTVVEDDEPEREVVKAADLQNPVLDKREW